MDCTLKLVQIIYYIAGSIAAVGALWVYKSNSRRERSKWIEGLYARFFENPELKAVRDKLDCSPDDAEVLKLVTEETAAWTDYLNFFEFVAYLETSKQLRSSDVNALLGYYLECFKKHEIVESYVRDKNKGYENLRKRLFNE